MPLEQATAYRDLPVQKVSREGLHEQVVEQMQELIFEKHLRSGSRLPGERELCERFGVSRTVIREASKVLAQRGLLVIEPGRGTFVTLPAEHDVARSIALFARARDVSFANLVEVRRALEPEIAELAAARATETHVQRLQACIEVMDRSLTDPEAYVAADQEFHSVLAEATGNDISHRHHRGDRQPRPERPTAHVRDPRGPRTRAAVSPQDFSSAYLRRTGGRRARCNDV